MYGKERISVMFKRFLSLLIAGIMLLGQGLSAVCLAAPHTHHRDRPAQHRWFNWWHRDNDRSSIKRSEHSSQNHKIKKKDSKHRWFKWRKNKQNIKKKQRSKKAIKRYEKNKKHVIKKHQKHQKKFQKNRKRKSSHNRHYRNHRSRR